MKLTELFKKFAKHTEDEWSSMDDDITFISSDDLDESSCYDVSNIFETKKPSFFEMTQRMKDNNLKPTDVEKPTAEELLNDWAFGKGASPYEIEQLKKDFFSLF